MTQAGEAPTSAVAERVVRANKESATRRVVTAGILAAVCVAVATALQLLRSPGVPPWDTLWQEDGGIFLTDALHHHLGNAIFKPYNGYLHVVPRLLAAIAVHLPLRDAGWVFALSSALIVSLVAAYIWWATRVLIPAAWARNVLALMVVLSPVSAYETANNINNLHWYLIFALAFVPFSQPAGRRGVAVNVVVAAAAVLSDSDALLLTPLFLPGVYAAFRARSWLRLMTPSVVAAALLVQFTVGARGQSPGRYAPSHVADLPGIFAFRVAASLLIGDRYTTELYDNYGLTFAYTCLVVLAILLLGAFWLAPASRIFIAVTFVGSLIFLAAPLLLRGTANFLTRPDATLNGSRYALLPVLFLAAGLLGAAARLAPRWDYVTGSVELIPALITVLAVSVVVFNYSDFNVRSPGPSWHTELAKADAICTKTSDLPREQANSAPGNPWGTQATPSDIIVPVAPSLPGIIPFAVLINCQELQRDLGRG